MHIIDPPSTAAMGWILEVFRMGLYLTFPVATFHYFARPEYFEKYVIETKRQIFPPEDEALRDGINSLFRDMRNGTLKEKIQQMENEKEDENKQT